MDAERECTIIELHTMPDRIHLLVECDPEYGLHRLVMQVKGRGGAPLEIVTQFVENQRRA